MKKSVLALILFLGSISLVRSQCGGNVNIDLASKVNANGTSTFNITTANPNELIMIAYNGWFGPGTGPITVDGLPATSIVTGHNSNDACAAIWAYSAPAAGLHTIVCTETGYSSPYYLHFAVGFYGSGACSKLTIASITANVVNAQASGTTDNVTINTTQANSMIFDSFVYNTGITNAYTIVAGGTTAVLSTLHIGNGIDASDAYTNAPAVGAYPVNTSDVNSCCGGIIALAAIQPCNCALPVQLKSFNCAPGNGNIELKWSTVTETNSNYFTIERSTDGIEFTSIARIDAAGNSENLRDYTYTDNSPFDGTNYYRLKEVDDDGTIQTFNVTECSNDNSVYAVIYPNPSKGNFTISLGPSTNTQTLVITDMMGKQVFKQQFEPNINEVTYSIVLPDKCKGVLIAKLLNGNQPVSVKKVVVY